jgi:hypothetical protein
MHAGFEREKGLAQLTRIQMFCIETSMVVIILDVPFNLDGNPPMPFTPNAKDCTTQKSMKQASSPIKTHLSCLTSEDPAVVVRIRLVSYR